MGIWSVVYDIFCLFIETFPLRAMSKVIVVKEVQMTDKEKKEKAVQVSLKCKGAGLQICLSLC
jgi:hypothetical protein